MPTPARAGCAIRGEPVQNGALAGNRRQVLARNLGRAQNVVLTGYANGTSHPGQNGPECAIPIEETIDGTNGSCHGVAAIGPQELEDGSLVAAAGLEDYVDELRGQVCRRCVSRVPGAPPCEDRGIGCGVEQHLEQLIDICRAVDSPLIDPYLERLKSEVCTDCAFQDEPMCPCPLKYLLPLAVGAVETVELRRRILADRLAWADGEMPETD